MIQEKLDNFIQSRSLQMSIPAAVFEGEFMLRDTDRASGVELAKPHYCRGYGFESGWGGMGVCCDYCVLSGIGLYAGRSTRPEESYRL
jgi:hypothetical protein